MLWPWGEELIHLGVLSSAAKAFPLPWLSRRPGSSAGIYSGFPNQQLLRIMPV